MRWILIIIGILVLLVATLAASFFVASESDEVVVLALPDGDERRLWVVDHKGHAWLRRGDGAGWINDIREADSIIVTRNGSAQTYGFEIISSGTDRHAVNQLTLDKYGLAEQYLRFLMIKPEQAAAIKLIPR